MIINYQNNNPHIELKSTTVEIKTLFTEICETKAKKT